MGHGAQIFFALVQRPEVALAFAHQHGHPYGDPADQGRHREDRDAAQFAPVAHCVPAAARDGRYGPLPVCQVDVHEDRIEVPDVDVPEYHRRLAADAVFRRDRDLDRQFVGEKSAVVIEAWQVEDAEHGTPEPHLSAVVAQAHGDADDQSLHAVVEVGRAGDNHLSLFDHIAQQGVPVPDLQDRPVRERRILFRGIGVSRDQIGGRDDRPDL